MATFPTLALETAVTQQNGFRLIAGIDEAGRGALAGPVVAAAVILPLHQPQTLALLHQVNDSKKVTAKTRDRLFDLITSHAVAYGVGIVEAAVIDEQGILPCTKQAMAVAVRQLQPPAQFLLIDGPSPLKAMPTPQKTVIRGDSLSLSIAAASILAKVTRDRLMLTLDAVYPLYGFAQHKGYGTAVHLQAIAQHGPSACHRLSFAPMRHAWFE